VPFIEVQNLNIDCSFYLSQASGRPLLPPPRTASKACAGEGVSFLHISLSPLNQVQPPCIPGFTGCRHPALFQYAGEPRSRVASLSSSSSSVGLVSPYSLIPVISCSRLPASYVVGSSTGMSSSHLRFLASLQLFPEHRPRLSPLSYTALL